MGVDSGDAGEPGRPLHASSTRVHASVPGCEPFGPAQAVADTLGVPVTVAALLVADLQAARGGYRWASHLIDA